MKWLQPLLNSEQSRAADSWAIEQCGISGDLLMQRAGRAVADAASHICPQGRIVVVCGKGNNGGDGVVAANILRGCARHVDVLTVWPEAEMSADAQAQLQQLGGEKPVPFDPGYLSGAELIIDALLGTGFSGAPREPLDGVIAAINSCNVAVLSVDVPSGVNTSTGEVEGQAINAVLTVTFHCGKPGLWINPGKRHAGVVEIADIGIPSNAPGTADVGLIEAAILERVPHRTPISTKFTSGNVSVVGGSVGLTGAPIMAGVAAMRAGAGYVTLLVGKTVEPIVAAAQPEIMSVALPDQGGDLVVDAVDTVLNKLKRADAVVLGSGMGRQSSTFDFTRALLPRVEAPVVLDADGLNAFEGEIERIAQRKSPTVLTPHAGELARLLNTTSAEIERQRLHHVVAAAQATNGIVVLKGDDTLIATAEGQVAISPGGAPALATAGTGDVLAGVIAAMLGKGLEPFEAVCVGVYMHVCAGRKAAQPHGPDGVIASDVIRALHELWRVS